MSFTFLPSIHAGCSWSATATYKDSEGVEVDLTGYTARSQFRKGKTVVLDLTSESEEPGIVLGGEEGTVTLAVTADQSADLTPGVLRFDVVLTSPAGAVSLLLGGECGVLDTVTQAD